MTKRKSLVRLESLVRLDDELEWGDCNKCGSVSSVNPDNKDCEYCGCADPEAEYPEEEWVVGDNPFRKMPGNS